MPRKTKHPGLRTHVRKGRDGQVWVYYYLDRRKEQLPDLPLGKDRDEALKLWDEARAKAATKSRESGDDDLAHEIEAMWLRDMRKYASDKAGSLDAAADLLQHSNKEVTRKHYQPAGTRLKTVR